MSSQNHDPDAWLRLNRSDCASWRPRLEELFLPIEERIDVVGGQLDTVAVGDGVRGTGFHAVAAKNAARIIYVVNLGITFAGGNSIGVGILSCFYINAIRGARCRAQKAAHTLLKTVFIALQNVNPAIAWLHTRGYVRKILGRRFAEHGLQRHAEAFKERYECFADFLN